MGKEDFRRCMFSHIMKDREDPIKKMKALHSADIEDCVKHIDVRDCDEGFSEYFNNLTENILGQHPYLEDDEIMGSIYRLHANQAASLEKELCEGKISSITKAKQKLSKNIDFDFRLPDFSDFKEMWVFNKELSWIQNLIKIANLVVIAFIIYMMGTLLLRFMGRNTPN